MGKKLLVANDESSLDIKGLFDKDIEIHSAVIKEELHGDLPDLEISFSTDDPDISEINKKYECSLKSGEGAEWKFGAFVYDMSYQNNGMTLKMICWDPKFTKEKFTTKYTSIKNAIESTCCAEIVGNPESATNTDILNFKDPSALYQRNETNHHFCTRMCRSFKYNTVFGYVLDGLLFVDLNSWKKDIELKERAEINLIAPSSWSESKLYNQKVEYIDYSKGKDPNHVTVRFYEKTFTVNNDYKELIGNNLYNTKLIASKNTSTFTMNYLPQFRVGQFATIPSDQIKFNECFISGRIVEFNKSKVSVTFTIQSINP